MKPAVAASLIARARAVLASGRPEMGEGEARSPVSRYLDAHRHAQELSMMRRHPQAVAPASVLARPGSWWSGDVLGVPLLVTRDGVGVLHAFLNVCRHRGARVVAPGEGCGRERFACPYHAWTYRADGALAAVPRGEGFPALDRDTSGLRALAVMQRGGIVWVIPSADQASADIGAMLGRFGDELETLGLDDHVGYAPRQRDLRCNWKLIVEGSSEAYHFKIAHRDSIAPLFADNVQIVDEDAANRRMFIVKEVLRGVREDAVPPPAIREVGNLLYFFFPSTMILVQPDHAQVTRLEPIATDTTRILDFALVPQPPSSDKARAHWDRNVQIYRAALDEDYAQMESIQAGLASGANESLRFGRFEFALARFNTQLDAELATVAA